MKRSPIQRILRVLRIIALVLLGLAGLAGIVAAAGWFYLWPANPPSQAAACARCHMIETHVNSIREPGLLVSDHARRGIECLDCHDMDTAQKFRETVTYFNLNGELQDPLRKLSYPYENCFECHEHGSYEQLAARTTDLGIVDGRGIGQHANPHQSHFADLECSTCHNMHRESEDFCAECHLFDWEVP